MNYTPPTNLAIKDSGLTEQIREEMREARDVATKKVLEKANAGDYTDAVTLDDFRKKHDV